MRKSVYGLATGLLIAAGVLTGCGKQAVQIQNTNTDNQEVNDELAQIQAAGVIKIGTEGTYAPMTYHDESGKLVGYEVEVAQAIADKLGVKAEFVETKWDSMIAGLDAGRFDIIVNEVSPTEERKEKYDFSNSYSFIHGAVIVPGDNEDIKSFADINGKKSAQSLTSNWGETAKENGAEIVGVDAFEQSIGLLLSGRADVTLNSELAYYEFMKEKPDTDIKIAALSEEVEESAIPVRKGETRLVEALNKALEELSKEGTLTEISEKYFGQDITKES